MKFWKLSLKIGALEIKLKLWILKTNSGNWEFENYSKMETLKIRFFYKKKIEKLNFGNEDFES